MHTRRSQGARPHAAAAGKLLTLSLGHGKRRECAAPSGRLPRDPPVHPALGRRPPGASPPNREPESPWSGNRET